MDISSIMPDLAGAPSGIAGVTTVQAEVPAQGITITPGAQPRAPTTTAQEDLTTAGQRRINLIWEYTQSIIAIVVVTANMIVAVYQGLTPPPLPPAGVPQFPTILSSSLFLIVGFYFSRTNHAAIGGTGTKPEAKYEGR